MHNLFRRIRARAKPGGLLARLPSVNMIFKWLSNLVVLTKEDQEDAGVYLGGEGRE
jgi:hypothetical protein